MTPARSREIQQRRPLALFVLALYASQRPPAFIAESHIINDVNNRVLAAGAQ
jgi:hypothetical protein